MDTVPHKVRMVIAGSTFEAEGDKDTVMEQYRLFLEALKAQGPNAAAGLCSSRAPLPDLLAAVSSG